MAQRFWIDIGKKMPTLYQQVGTGGYLMPGGHLKQSAIVTYPQVARRRLACEVAGDKIELVIQRVLGLTPRSGLHLLRANVCSHFVEHAIDELETVGTTKRFGQFNRFVDGDLVRHFNMMDQFKAAN